MSIRNAILFIGVITFLAACNINRSEDAMQLSKQITTANDSLMFYGKQWSDELKIAVGVKDFTQLQVMRSNMQGFLEQKILDINTMHDVGGSEALRKAELAVLNFDRDSILPKLMVFEAYDANTPDQQILDAYRNLTDMFHNEQVKLQEVSVLSDKYADANDFPKPINTDFPRPQGGAMIDTTTATSTKP